MSNPMIVTKEGEILTNTRALSKHYGIDHRRLKDLVRKYKNDLDELGDASAIVIDFIKSLNRTAESKPIRGRPVESLILNGRQALFILIIVMNQNSLQTVKLLAKWLGKESLKRMFEDLLKK